MSFIRIISEVWCTGAHMLYTILKDLLRPKTLSRPEKIQNTLLTTAFKDPFDTPITPLPALDGRSRPSWMTHGFNSLSHYENHTESFPSFDIQDPDAELEAMHAAHSYANLLSRPTPVFPPSTTPIDTNRVTPSMTHRTTDISIHKEEAYSALSSAMNLACGTPLSRYTLKHPAFTPPKPYHGLPHSPLVGAITRYIEHTHRSLPYLIRVASPNQIRLELETCLLLEFAPYVHSGSFYDDESIENSVVPLQVFARVEDAVNGEFESLVRVRDAIERCEKLEVEGGEEFLGIWKAWKWVIECFVGAMVLRDEGRKEGDVTWVKMMRGCSSKGWW